MELMTQAGGSRCVAGRVAHASTRARSNDTLVRAHEVDYVERTPKLASLKLFNEHVPCMGGPFMVHQLMLFFSKKFHEQGRQKYARYGADDAGPPNSRFR